MIKNKRKRDYNAKGKIYIEAKYLKDFGFDKGQNIIYKFNKKKGTCKVKAVNYSSSITKKVYKTTGRVGVVPVIDIRTEDVKKFFNENNEFEMTIVKGLIIFKVKKAVKSKGLGKILSFKRKEQLYSISAKKMAKVVNSDQISFFDLFSQDISEESSESGIIDSLKKKAIKMISLFSGAGMLDKGFLDNGNFDITFAVDTHEKKRLKSYHIDTYKKNIGNHIIEKDVMELTKADTGTADFVVGGVPCVKFSKLNTKDNFRDSDADSYPLLDKFIDVVKWSDAKGFLIDYLYNSYNINLNYVVSIIKIRI